LRYYIIFARPKKNVDTKCTEGADETRRSLEVDAVEMAIESGNGRYIRVLQAGNM